MAFFHSLNRGSLFLHFEITFRWALRRFCTLNQIHQLLKKSTRWKRRSVCLLVPLVKFTHSVSLIKIKDNKYCFLNNYNIFVTLDISGIARPIGYCCREAALALPTICYSVCNNAIRRLRPLRLLYHLRKASAAHYYLLNLFKGD